MEKGVSKAFQDDSANRCFLVLAILVFLGALCSTRANAESTDPLWQKAVEIISISQGLVPGNVEVRFEWSNSKGKIISSQEHFSRNYLGDDGQVAVEILRVMKDGKDITEEQQLSATETPKNLGQTPQGNQPKNDDAFAGIPFLREMQESVEVKPLGRQETIGKTLCVLYSYSLVNPDGEINNGTAWLDADSGYPVQIQFEPKTLPKHVSKMTTKTIFSLQSGGYLCPTEVTMEMTVKFLLIKIGMRIQFKHDNYWQYIEK